MTQANAISKAYQLHIEWVSEREIIDGKGFDLNRIHSSMVEDYRFRRAFPKTCTPGYLRELRGQLVLLGKIKKLLA